MTAATRFSNSRRIGVSMLLALGTAGCFYNETDLTATRPLVEWQDSSHRVSYEEGQSRLSSQAQAGLDSFVSRQAEGASQVTILIGQEEDQARRDLQRRRASGLAAYMRARNLQIAQVTAVPGTAYRNSVVVSVGRLKVVTPNCPDWKRVQQGGTMIGGREQFGCVTAASLGSMVANPNDLIRGRDTGGADGTAMSRGVRDYRSGKLGKDQDNPAFKVSSSGTGN